MIETLIKLSYLLGAVIAILTIIGLFYYISDTFKTFKFYNEVRKSYVFKVGSQVDTEKYGAVEIKGRTIVTKNNSNRRIKMYKILTIGDLEEKAFFISEGELLEEHQKHTEV